MHMTSCFSSPTIPINKTLYTHTWVGIAALRIRALKRPFRVRVHSGVQTLLQSIQSHYSAHLTYCPIDNGVLFHDSKAAGTSSWPLNAILYQCQEYVQLYAHTTHILVSWCLIKHRNKVTSTFTYIFKQFLLKFRKECRLWIQDQGWIVNGRRGWRHTMTYTF